MPVEPHGAVKVRRKAACLEEHVDFSHDFLKSHTGMQEDVAFWWWANPRFPFLLPFLQLSVACHNGHGPVFI